MEWKNQLTKTPYLVLFIVLISIGVGTASALITITLSGNVIVTGDLTGSNDVTVGNHLYIGDSDEDHDIRFFEDGNPNGERFQWDDSADRFEFSDDAAVFGDFEVQGTADVIGPIFNHRTAGLNTGNLIIERSGGPTADNTQFVLSHRSTDQDLWIYGYNGTTFKNFVGFDYPNHKITFPSWGDTLVIDAANDMVGIGTDTPSSELDVVGDVSITGNLTAGGTIGCSNCILGFYTNAVGFEGTGENIGATANCDSGDISTGGGFGTFFASDFPPFLSRSFNDTSWSAHWSSTNLNSDYSVHVKCADYPPAHEP